MNDTATAADRLAAECCRLSRRLVMVCGLGASSAAPELAVTLAPLAGMFAWHAELLYDVLPVRADIDRDRLVDDGIAGADEAMDLLDELVEAGDAVAARSALALVVDWLAAHADREVLSNNPLLEGPRARAYTLVARDLEDASTALDLLTVRLAGGVAPSPGALEAVVRIGAALGTTEVDVAD